MSEQTIIAELCPSEFDEYLITLQPGQTLQATITFETAFVNSGSAYIQLELYLPSLSSPIEASVTNAISWQTPVVTETTLRLRLIPPPVALWHLKYVLQWEADIPTNLAFPTSGPSYPSSFSAFPDPGACTTNFFLSYDSPTTAPTTVTTLPFTVQRSIDCPGEEYRVWVDPTVVGSHDLVASVVAAQQDVDFDIAFLNASTGAPLAVNATMGHDTFLRTPWPGEKVLFRVLLYRGLESSYDIDLTLVPTDSSSSTTTTTPTTSTPSTTNGGGGGGGVVLPPLPNDDDDDNQGGCTCPGDVSMGITWPSTVACGSTARLQCPDTTKGRVALRQCLPTGRYGAVDATACVNDALQTLASAPITRDTAAAAAAELEASTRTAVAMGASDVVAVESVMRGVGEQVSEDMGHEAVRNITRQLARSLNVVMGLGTATIQAAQENSTSSLAATFGSVMATVSRALPVNSSEVVVESSLIAAAYNFGAGQRFVQFSYDSGTAVVSSSSSSSGGGGSSSGSETRMELSADVDMQFFSFAKYADSRLFLDNVTDTNSTLQSSDEDAYVLTPVLLAQAEDQDGNAFSGTVSFLFQLLPPPKEERSHTRARVSVRLSVYLSVCLYL